MNNYTIIVGTEILRMIAIALLSVMHYLTSQPDPDHSAQRELIVQCLGQTSHVVFGWIV